MKLCEVPLLRTYTNFTIFVIQKNKIK